ncbi:hypothetical protein AEP_03033 [Curvibacter sp. AEP1-3]|jgi:hypothetical protein|nr:hypothetical protein AEP_03033 [Curvibacter sp. AEP1-3]
MAPTLCRYADRCPPEGAQIALGRPCGDFYCFEKVLNGTR